MAVVPASDMLRGSPLPGWSGRFFHSATMTFAHWEIAAGAADLHEHHHEQEEVWQVVDGELTLVLDGEEHRLRAGDAAVVPPNARHAVRTLGPCRAVVADFPRRERLPGVKPPGQAPTGRR